MTEYQFIVEAVALLQKIDEEVFEDARPIRLLSTRTDLKRLVDTGIQLITKSKEGL